jgi:hypothetical protein
MQRSAGLPVLAIAEWLMVLAAAVYASRRCEVPKF